MIITCPNCGARYRLDPAVVARGARMRCAECEHRWVPEAPAPHGAEPDVAGPVAAPAMPSPVAETAVPSAPQTPDVAGASVDDDAYDDVPRSRPWRTLLAVVVGLALAVGAAAVWLGQQPAPVPWLAALQPARLHVQAEAKAVVTVLPSGERLMEITGRVRNPGPGSERVTGIDARLKGPAGIVRRWRIELPPTRIGPGAAMAFSSTITGFPADATTLELTPRG